MKVSEIINSIYSCSYSEDYTRDPQQIYYLHYHDKGTTKTIKREDLANLIQKLEKE